MVTDREPQENFSSLISMINTKLKNGFIKMKIHEIISYNNEINEGYFSSGLASLLGKSSDDILKNIMSLIDHNTGKISSSLSATEKALIDKYPKLAKKAEKIDQKDISKAKNAENWAYINSKIAGIKKDIETTNSFLLKVSKLAVGAWWWEVATEPLRDYISEISDAATALEEGRITAEYYENYKKQRMSILIGKLGEQLLIRGLIGGVIGFLAKAPVTNHIFSKVVGLTPVAQAYFMNKVNTKEGSEAVATIMLNPIVTGTVGGLAVAAENKISNFLNDAIGNSTNAPAAASSKVTKEPEPRVFYRFGLTDNNRVNFSLAYYEVTMNADGINQLIQQLEFYRDQLEPVEQEE